MDEESVDPDQLASTVQYFLGRKTKALIKLI